MTGNASAAFPASLLIAFATLSNHFFKVPLSFDGGPPGPPLPPPKRPVMARIIVKIVMYRVVSIAAIVIPCSRNKVRNLSAKDISYQKPFQGFA